jgi:hypothetical protein
MEGGGPPHAGQGLRGRRSLRLAATTPPEHRRAHSAMTSPGHRALEVLIIVNTPMARSRARSPAPAPAQASRASASIQIRITEIRDGRETARWCPPSPSAHHIISRVVASTQTPDTINTGTPQSDVRSSSRASATCGPASTGRVSIEKGAGSASPPRHKSVRGQNARAGGISIIARTASGIRHTLASMFLPEGFPQVSSRAPLSDQCQRL